MPTTEHIDTIVIGAGQAGLATAYHLARTDQHFAVLDDRDRIGDVWRERFDSLRLYSPAKYDGLPGLPMPLPRGAWPGKDDMGDYLEAYARRFDLPVRTGVRVEHVSREGGRFTLGCGDQRLTADNVVVATGGWQRPRTPSFAAELDPAIRQMHSNDYKNPSQLQPGAVLVVGLSHSGGDIALEASATHPTTVAGPVRGEIPFALEGRLARVLLPVLWFAANHVLTERTPVGRRMGPHVRSEGGPLLRVKRAHLDAAGVERVEAKVTGTRDGKPMLDGGRVLDVQNVIWCTGFDKDVSWITDSVIGADGWPDQERGRVASAPGLYFVGLPFQYAFASMLVGGVGRDAGQVAAHIARRAGRTAGRKRPERIAS